MKFLVISTLCILFLNGVLGYKLICVYTNWSQYRADGGKFFPEDVDTSLCTHLIYVYAKLKGNELAPVEWNDDGNAWKGGMYQKFNDLKQYNPDLKTLLGVGGWNMGGRDFSRMASTPRSRRRFAKSAVTFLRERNFDGLTIDWQHPTKRGGQRRDRVNFSLLLQELRRAFEEESRKTNQPTLLLSIGVSASKYIIDSAYEPHNISKYVDFMNVFAYDLHGPWDNYTGHPSPLYAREDELGPASEINVDASMKYWISLGIDRNKLVLGISTYGRTFTLKEARYNGYGVPTSGPGAAEKYTREPGMIAYYERCSTYFDAPRIWDKHSKVAYWHSGEQWIGGEDVESVKYKVYWARQNGIDAFMFWSMDTDDFAGTCSSKKFDLHNALKKELDNPTQPRTTVQPTQTTDPTVKVDNTRTPITSTTALPIKKVSRKVTKIPRPLKTEITKRPNEKRKSNQTTMKATNSPKRVITSVKLNKQIISKDPKVISTPKPMSSANPKLQVKQKFKINNREANFMNKRTEMELTKSNKKTPGQSESKNRQNQAKPKIPSRKGKSKIETDKNNNQLDISSSKDQKRKPKKRNPKKGRRQKLTRAQRLRIIKHRRRMMARRKQAKKRKTTTPLPKANQTKQVEQ